MKPGTWQIWGSVFSSRSIASNYLYHQEVCSIVNLLKKTENLFHSRKLGLTIVRYAPCSQFIRYNT